jgi:hypothetical protein
MRISRPITFYLFFLILTCFYCSRASAAAITNLDDEPQTIMLECCGNPSVTIAPCETWHMLGKAKIRYHGRELSIGVNEEYAIWKDGNIGPQRYLRGGAGLNKR